MKVAKIIISNILGIVNLEIEPGKVTTISGENGSGKTSTMEAIKACLQGGSQAELLRDGAEKGEIVMVLEDGVKITKTITAEETKIRMDHPEYGKVSKPMQFIEKLADAMSVNPIEFLECVPKDRADFLLEAMPIEVDKEALLAIVTSDVPLPDMKQHGLKILDEIHETIFTRRQDINRTVKEKKGTIEQLSASLPATLGTDLKAEIEALETECKQTEDQHASDEKNAKKEYDESVAGITELKEATLRSIQKDYDLRLAELNKWKEKHVADAGEIFQQAKDEAQKRKETLISDSASLHGPRVAQLKQSIALKKQANEDTAKHQNTAEVVEKMKTEVTKLENKSTQMTERLDSLAVYKNGLLKNLPIAGIEIKGGKVFRNGIAYETLNTAQQIQIAVDLAVLRAKELGLICLDGAERLDSKRLKALEEAINATGLQIIVTRVADGEFAVASK